MARRSKSHRQNPNGYERTQRQLRAGELMRHALVDILAREDFRDPDLLGVSVTIGEVRVSPDLRHASIFCSPLGVNGGAEADKVAAGLNRAAGFLRGRLGREIDMKFTPQLNFIADHSYDAATEMDKLFRNPKVQQDLASDDADDGEDEA